MEKQTMEELKDKHLENYKLAVYEILKSNTKGLFEEDILSLLKKPPLDSMDIIKCKFLNVAKKYKTLIVTEELDRCLNLYRQDAIKIIYELEKERINFFEDKIMLFKPNKEIDVIKFNKKDFNTLNKKIKNQLKKSLLDIIDKNIVKNVNKLFTENSASDGEQSLSREMVKFLQTTYIKQLLESVDFKIIVKDTTLINRVKEQGERYLFTKKNSYLLNGC